MKLSLRQAAEMTGRTKSAVFQAIKAGKLNAIKNEQGLIIIELADLNAAFPVDKRDEPRRGRPAGGKLKATTTELPENTPSQNPQNGKQDALYLRIIDIETENARLKEATTNAQERFEAALREIQDYKTYRELDRARIRELETKITDLNDTHAALTAEKERQIEHLRRENTILLQQSDMIKEYFEKHKDKNPGFFKKLFA